MPHHKSLGKLKAKKKKKKVKRGQKESLDLSEYCLGIVHSVLLDLSSSFKPASLTHSILVWLSQRQP
jgi:hypothetical protein